MQETGFFIILKKVKYSEADLIITALSNKGEKKSFLARSALKSKKRFGGGVLEPTHYVKLTFSNKEEKNQLNILEEAQLIHDFYNLRKDYDILEFALQAVDCILRVSQEGVQDSEALYNLLGHILKNLNKEGLNKANDFLILKLQFYLKFLSEQGVLSLESWMLPYLQQSLSGHEKLRERIEVDKINMSVIEAMIEHYIRQ